MPVTTITCRVDSATITRRKTNAEVGCHTLGCGRDHGCRHADIRCADHAWGCLIAGGEPKFHADRAGGLRASPWPLLRPLASPGLPQRLLLVRALLSGDATNVCRAALLGRPFAIFAPLFGNLREPARCRLRKVPHPICYFAVQ